MSDRTSPPEPQKPAKAREKPARLAEALRANLARRKAQTRARATPRQNRERDGQER